MKKLENLDQVLSVLYLSKYYSGEQYLSIKQLISITKMPESTLKGILKNLVEQRWVEKRLLFSDLNGYPELRTDYLQKIMIMKINSKVKTFWVPRSFIPKFTHKLKLLTRSKKQIEIGDTVKVVVQTYKDMMGSMDKRKKSRIENDFSLTFKGRTKLVRSLLENWTNKKPIFFYRILVYPYVIDKRVEGRTKLTTKKMIAARWHDVPKKDEIFWEEAAEKLKQKRKRLS